MVVLYLERIRSDRNDAVPSLLATPRSWLAGLLPRERFGSAYLKAATPHEKGGTGTIVARGDVTACRGPERVPSRRLGTSASEAAWASCIKQTSSVKCRASCRVSPWDRDQAIRWQEGKLPTECTNDSM